MPGPRDVVVRRRRLRAVRDRPAHRRRRVPADALPDRPRPRVRRGGRGRGRARPAAWPRGRASRSTRRCSAADCAILPRRRAATCARTGARSATRSTGPSPSTCASRPATPTRWPRGMSDREGALVEPGVLRGARAAPAGELRAGERALVIGAGTMGLILLQLLLRDGASRSRSWTWSRRSWRWPPAGRERDGDVRGGARRARRASTPCGGRHGRGRGDRGGRGRRAPRRAAHGLRRRAGRGDDAPVAVSDLQRRDHRAGLDGGAATLRARARPHGRGRDRHGGDAQPRLPARGLRGGAEASCGRAAG